MFKLDDDFLATIGLATLPAHNHLLIIDCTPYEFVGQNQFTLCWC